VKKIGEKIEIFSSMKKKKILRKILRKEKKKRW